MVYIANRMNAREKHKATNYLKCFVLDEFLDSINDEKPLFLVIITNVTCKNNSVNDVSLYQQGLLK